MSVLAIIPARAGSKGIRNKNFRICAGKMLLEWSIEAAKNSQYVAGIVLSTDTDGTGERIAKKHGIKHHARLPEHATDEAQIEDAMRHILTELYIEQGYEPEIIVLLQPTSPFRPTGIIDRCIDMLRETGADSVLTGHRSHALSWLRRSDGTLWPSYGLPERPRRQDQPVSTQENGSVFVTTRESFVKTGIRCGGRIEVVDVPKMYSVEVDEPHDLELAEWLLSR